MKMFSIYTIRNGEVSPGAAVEAFTLKGAGATIPAILTGEEGRGRELGILPVTLTSAQKSEWEGKGSVEIAAAIIDKTRTGKPKLVAGDTRPPSSEKAICVFRTQIGFRGGNSHTGDWRGDWYVSTLQHSHLSFASREEAELFCMENELHTDWIRKASFYPFPGTIISSGTIAQGDAGRMGSGKQIVAVMPRDTWFRTAYSGRLYGAPSAHYYRFDGKEILAVTGEEKHLLEEEVI